MALELLRIPKRFSRTNHTNTVESVSIDDLLTLIANPRRRETITILADRDEPTEKRELVEAIAYTENNTVEHPTDLTRQQKKRVLVSLHQSHLPALEDAGVIERDRNLLWPNDSTHRVARVINEIRRMVTTDRDGDH